MYNIINIYNRSFMFTNDDDLLLSDVINNALHVVHFVL